MAQTTYTAPHTNKTLAYGWNPFQSSPTNSQLEDGATPPLHLGTRGASSSNSQDHVIQAPVRLKLPFLETLNFLDLSKLMNDLVKHDAT